MRLECDIYGGNNMSDKSCGWAGSVELFLKTDELQARDPHQLRINSYRVLLTRGRDGFVIFVPPTAEMKETYRALKDAGVAELD